MSGHSKWSTIKRQKGTADQRRGALFSRLGREIMVAARDGGANPDGNFRLRLAIEKGRNVNMPLENIERAIKKGAGGGEGVQMIDVILEGYGPHGMAIIVEALTDNRNRTVQEIRSVFNRHNGNFGEGGSVSWLFETKGLITIDADGEEAEELALIAIDAGADDVKTESNYIEITTEPSKLELVKKAVEKRKQVSNADISKVPKTAVVMEGEKEALQALKFIEALEELEDVQKVYSNADFSESILEKIKGQL